MKALLFKSVIVLFVLSSCSTGKSFMHQRYTSLGHKKHHTETQGKTEYASVKKENKAAEPVLVTNVPAAEQTTYAQTTPQVLTASATKNTAVLKRRPIARLTESNLVTTASKTVKHASDNVFNKEVKKENKKHGLLFGLINAVLSIIILVVFVALII